ncbi:PREDICTED: uncharacterized protein LOC104817664 isoform X2 [Tarenaya hassleriana]|uniref:uncharacterized protein LOC104817664 isoform X2 n=1 Tax=Tarenaya hassleriana TaxID=28532 RepID=UPI00053CA88A|nr:PREDICTED: uncharacterized protein LOC104817664 isoform X2 [Tarenaya hassleriana]
MSSRTMLKIIHHPPANVVAAVRISCQFDFLYSDARDAHPSGGVNVQSIMKCICPRPFSRSLINKGLLHSDLLVKHGTLRFLLETLQLLDSFFTAFYRCSSSRSRVQQIQASLEQEIQNEVRNYFPDSQVFLTLLSSLGGHFGNLKQCVKRKAGVENELADTKGGFKRSKKSILEEDNDIIIGGIGSDAEISLLEDAAEVVDTHMNDEVDAEKEFLWIVSEIWGPEICSKPIDSLKDAEVYFHIKLLDALKIYLDTVHNVLEGSFDFFLNLLSNSSSMPADLQRALLSLLNQHVSWTHKSQSDRIPMRTPPLMYKHLHILINLLLFSPRNEVKDLAYDLALVAMNSTGAFDKDINEIGAWFLFLPGFGMNKLPPRVQEAVQSMTSIVISFLCDAVSTVGNNLFKHWDIIRTNVSNFKDFKGVSIGFSPLVVCALQKCLRLLNSDSKTYSLPEKSTISLYVCSTLKFLLQTQVHAGLLSSLIQSILSEVVDDSKDSFCEWRPLRTLLHFSQTLLDQKPCCLYSGRRRNLRTDNSFAETLHEVKSLLRRVMRDEISGIVKAFSSALLSATTDAILQYFAPVMTVSWALFGAPFSVLCPIAFLEENFLSKLSKQFANIFVQGSEITRSMNLDQGTGDGEIDISDHSSLAEEIIRKMDISETGSSAFSIFLNQAPFHILFPLIMSMDVSCLEEPQRIADLLLIKILESKGHCIVSYIRLTLFWFFQVRSSSKVRPASVLSQLSEICLFLMKHLFSQMSKLKLDSEASPSKLVMSSDKWKHEVVQTVLCHPMVLAFLESPLSCSTAFEAQNFEICLATFLPKGRPVISEIDHHILDLLASTFENFLFDEEHITLEMDCGVDKSAMTFKSLVDRLLLEYRLKLELCAGTENFTPLLQVSYSIHALLRFISPFQLLNLARLTLSRVDEEGQTIKSSGAILGVGLGIAGGAFEMLSLYFQQPPSKRQIYDLLWEFEENNYDSDLIEDIFGLACKFSSSFGLDSADICLLRAVSAMFKGRHKQNYSVHPLTLILSQTVEKTPKELILHCINRANMTRSKLLFYLVELSPLHRSVFGSLFSSVLNKGQGESALSDDQLLMLLPAALSYLGSAFVNLDKKYHRNLVKITSGYSRMLLNGFLRWQSFLSGSMFQEKYEEIVSSTSEEIENLFNASLLGKAIHMLQFHFHLSGSLTKTEGLSEVFHSIFPHSSGCDEMLEYELKELDFHSVDKMVNVAIRSVAKVSFLRMWIFPGESGLCDCKGETDNSVKESSLETVSTRDNLSICLMNILVNSWQCIVKESTSVYDGSFKGNLEGKRHECLSLCKSLEDFILRSILEFAKTMCERLVELDSLPFMEKLMKSTLVYRFEDSVTLKRLRDIFSLLSGGKYSYAPYLQLLISHSQFTPTISSLSKSSCSHTVELFRPVSSILKHLIVPSPNFVGLGNSVLRTPEHHMNQLEIVQIVRVLLSKCGKEAGINLRELHFLLLCNYSASLSEIDLEIYNLMHDIELIDGSHTLNVSETDYLWGKAAMEIRRDMSLALNVGDSVKAESVKEVLNIDPTLCASTVMFFPYQRSGANELQVYSDVISEKNSSMINNIEQYDPAFVLRFSIHSLSENHIELVEFASSGLLAVAFASMSSADLEMRKLGYKTLEKFVEKLNPLKSGQKNNRIECLRLLLAYVQNGIDEQWLRIPTVSAVFAAEASLILLDSSHEHHAALKKFMGSSPRLKMKGIPMFHEFFWSTAVNFRSQRLWELRLLYVGLNSEDDAQVYIRNSILETLISFYSSPLADNETKRLILQVVKKSVKFIKMARHLTGNCGLFSWLSSTMVMFTAKLLREEDVQLADVLAVITDVLSSRNVVEWLQRCALEELMELSLCLYRLLFGRLVSTEENATLVDSIVHILSATLKISQKRKMYQPHFTLSLEGIFQLYEAVTNCNSPPATASAELGLRAILMSTPPVDIIWMDSDTLTSFLLWATSTALKCDLGKGSKPNESHQDAKTFPEESQGETMVSKFLRWLIASVILGKLYYNRAHDSDQKLCRKSDIETLQSLLEFVKQRYKNGSELSNSKHILGVVIMFLQQHLGTNFKILPSVVCALSFMLLNNGLGNEGLTFAGDDFIKSLCSRISSPPEANPAWRWSYYQAWKDLSSEPSTDKLSIDELHACRHLLLIFSDMLGPKPSDPQTLQRKYLEISDVFDCEKCMAETE